MIINIRAWELNCFYYSITWDSQTSCINNQLADSDHHSSRDELSTCSFIQNLSFDLRNNIMRRQFIAFLCNISSLAGNFFLFTNINVACDEIGARHLYMAIRIYADLHNFRCELFIFCVTISSWYIYWDRRTAWKHDGFVALMICLNVFLEWNGQFSSPRASLEC